MREDYERAEVGMQREVRKNHCPRSHGKSVSRGSTGDHVKCHTEVTF